MNIEFNLIGWLIGAYGTFGTALALLFLVVWIFWAVKVLSPVYDDLDAHKVGVFALHKWKVARLLIGTFLMVSIISVGHTYQPRVVINDGIGNQPRTTDVTRLPKERKPVLDHERIKKALEDTQDQTNKTWENFKKKGE